MKHSLSARVRRPPGPLRVLYLQPCASFGGAERQASIVIPRLLRAGVDVVPLVGPAPTIVRWLNDQGVDGVVRTDSFPGQWSTPQLGDQVLSLRRYWRCLRGIAAEVDRLIVGRNIDLVFAAMPFSWLAATGAARRRGVPVVWRAGGTAVHALARSVLRAFASFRPPDLLLCCTDTVARTFAPLCSAPVAVVDNGVELQRFRSELARPARHRPPGARLVVGYAARLAPEKCPEDFIEMAARLRPRHPGVAFLMAGEGSRRARCEALIRARGLEGVVHVLGYVEDVRSFYAACDVLTLPSRSEGLPNMVLESMSMGRALVVSDRVARCGVIAHEREGLVFPVGEIDAYTREVDRLLSSEPLRVSLGKAAQRRVHRSYDADQSAAQIAALLRDLVAGEADTANGAASRPLTALDA
jgi:glycosyltransferase involved in cell wall biosynthesis